MGGGRLRLFQMPSKRLFLMQRPRQREAKDSPARLDVAARHQCAARGFSKRVMRRFGSTRHQRHRSCGAGRVDQFNPARRADKIPAIFKHEATPIGYYRNRPGGQRCERDGPRGGPFAFSFEQQCTKRCPPADCSGLNRSPTNPDMPAVGSMRKPKARAKRIGSG